MTNRRTSPGSEPKALPTRQTRSSSRISSARTPVQSTCTSTNRVRRARRNRPANANSGKPVQDSGIVVNDNAAGPSTAAKDVTSDRFTTPPPRPAATPSAVQGTPTSNKVSGTNPYTSMYYVRDERMRRLGAEMAGKFIGPMPVVDFLDTFLPSHRATTLSRNQTRLLQSASTQPKEPQMYSPLVRVCLTF